jgi:proline dehydrogenase
VIAGANVLRIPLSNEEEFLERIVSMCQSLYPPPKLVMLNFPHNPTGTLASKELFAEIVRYAKKYNFMVRIDMESSDCTDQELILFEKLYLEFPANVGIVLQSYLKRTFSDLERLQKISIIKHPINIRLCKGIYIEPADIAYKKKEEINTNFIRCLEFMMVNKLYPAIATHDKSLIQNCLSLISQYKKDNDEYEFQMLYGVTPKLRDRIVNDGHKMRIYIPYGKHWFNYSTRRLKENPHLVRDIILGFLVRQ